MLASRSVYSDYDSFVSPTDRYSANIILVNASTLREKITWLGSWGQEIVLTFDDSADVIEARCLEASSLRVFSKPFHNQQSAQSHAGNDDHAYLLAIATDDIVYCTHGNIYLQTIACNSTRGPWQATSLFMAYQVRQLYIISICKCIARCQQKATYETT